MTHDTARAIVETHGADYLLSVKANCPDTFAQLTAIDWEGEGIRSHAGPRWVGDLRTPPRAGRETGKRPLTHGERSGAVSLPKGHQINIPETPVIALSEP